MATNDDERRIEHIRRFLRDSVTQSTELLYPDWNAFVTRRRLEIGLKYIDYARAREIASELRPTTINIQTEDDTIRHDPFVGAEPNTLRILRNPVFPIPKNAFLTDFEAISCAPPVDVVDRCESLRRVRFDRCRVTDELVTRLAARVDLELCRCSVSAELVVAAFRIAAANQRTFNVETYNYENVAINDALPSVATVTHTLHIVPSELPDVQKLIFLPGQGTRLQLNTYSSAFEHGSRAPHTISWPVLDTLCIHYLPRSLGLPLVAPNLRVLQIENRFRLGHIPIDVCHDDALVLPTTLRRVVTGDFQIAMLIHNTPPFPDVERGDDESLRLRNHPARAVLALFSAPPNHFLGNFVERGVDLGRLLFSILLGRPSTHIS
jgi:hypothetical protein